MLVSWIVYAAARLDESLETLWGEWYLKPKAQEDADIIAKARATAETCFDRLEDTLRDRPFLLGQE